MNTTKILGEAVGIQRQDIIDRTEEQIADGLTGAVILGRFKRGRVDAPMDIHLGNIRGQLGYDPKNPAYIAVQDCLDTGVPSVQVLRVNKAGSHALYISPDLQYSVSGVNEIVDGNVILWNIEVDNVLYPQKLGWVGYEPETYVFLEDYLEANQNILGIMAKYEEDEITEKSSLRIYSITSKRKFVRLIPNVHYISRMNLTGNPTAKIDSDGIISFWLEANNEVQIPAPEPEVCNCEASWILIPELTPTATFNGNDEVFVAVKDVAQSNGMALSNNKPIIEIIEQMMTNVFSNHLEVIRCDSEGTLFRNKTDSCLTLSIWGSIRNASGDKEFFSYLSDKDLCAYDASEVIPNTSTPIEPENWDIKYKVNGQWIYETTGPIVELSEERNNTYRNLATELVFNDTVTEVGYKAFKYWANLKSVDFGQSMTKLQPYAFEFCTGITKMVMPNTLKSVESCGIGGCSGLKVLDFGTSLENLGSSAVGSLYNLQTFVFRASVPPSLGDSVFGNSSHGGTNPSNIYVPDNLFDVYAEALWNLGGRERLRPLSTYIP